MSPRRSRRHWLQTSLQSSLLALAGLPVLGHGARVKAPNILFILADDLGYADLSVYGQPDFKTPVLDRLAAQGVRLTQAYANSAVCSATRMALITGRYQYRLPGGLEEPITLADPDAGLPPEHPTLPSLLKRAGYRTALFGNYGGAIDYFNHRPQPDLAPDLFEGETPVQQIGYYTHLLGARAARYVRDAPRRGAPFFLSLHFTAPHWPWEGPGDEAVSRTLTDTLHHDGGNRAPYAAMVKAMDTAVGQVLAALDASGGRNETIVVFTSDNGGERFSNTWPFSGQKTELLEGGIRVPAIVRWPARLKPRTVCPQVAMSMDWLPTLLAAAGASPDASCPSDGVDLLPVLAGQAAPFERTLHWRYKAATQRAIRSGDWKCLRINDNEFLFDVVADPLERANLAGKHPQVFAALKHRWDAWNAGMLPSPPQAYSHSISPRDQTDHYVSPPD